MSPLPIKYGVEQNIVSINKSEQKGIKEEIKLTPKKAISNNEMSISSSGNKMDIDNSNNLGLKKTLKMSEPRSDSKRNSENIEKLEISMPTPKSEEKLRKVSHRSPKTAKQSKMPKRSPLIPNQKLETGLFSPDSNIYDGKLIRDSDNQNESSPISPKQFSARKVLDFADKSQEFKGRNLFDDHYQ